MQKDPATRPTTAHGYQMFMLALCVFALIALGLERAVPVAPDLKT